MLGSVYTIRTKFREIAIDNKTTMKKKTKLDQHCGNRSVRHKGGVKINLANGWMNASRGINILIKFWKGIGVGHAKKKWGREAEGISYADNRHLLRIY